MDARCAAADRPQRRAHRGRHQTLHHVLPDAAAEYTRLVTNAGLSPVLELCDEDFGQRHFIITDPAGNLIDVIENIPPSDAFEVAYHPTAP